MTRLLTLALTALLPWLAMTAVTPQQAFADAPAEVLPTIDRMTRLDMLDYFNSGSPKPSKNAFKGDCRILSADDSQLNVATSEVSETSISLIPMGSDTIIMVISTLKTPVDDSSIRFYTSTWTQLGGKLFQPPTFNDWLKPDARTRKDDIENACPFILAKASYEPATGILSLTNTTGDAIPQEDTTLVNNSMRAGIAYRWNGKKMEMSKD